MWFSVGALEAQHDEVTHLMKDARRRIQSHFLPAAMTRLFFFLEDMHFSNVNLVEKSQPTSSEYNKKQSYHQRQHCLHLSLPGYPESVIVAKRQNTNVLKHPDDYLVKAK